MKQSIIKVIKSALITALVSSVFLFHTAWSAGVMVEKAWSLALPAVSKNGAAYLTIQNHGPADKLLSASSEIAEEVQIHNIVHVEGQMKMQQLEAVEIPMHGSIDFEPGGMHIMLLGLKEPLEDGGHYSLKLNFEQAGEVNVMVRIEMDDDGAISGGHSGHSGHSNSDD